MLTTRLMITLLTLRGRLTQDTGQRRDRGSVSTEQAIVTGAIVLLATIVVAAITAYAKSKLAVLN